MRGTSASTAGICGAPHGRMVPSKLFVFLACLVLCWGTGLVAAESLSLEPLVRYACEPCIERTDNIVRFIVHGSEDDVFWQQVSEAAWQIADSLRVTLQFDLYERQGGFLQMAADVRQVAAAVATATRAQEESSSAAGDASASPDTSFLQPRGRNRDIPNVLVVTLPSKEVEEAVREVVATGLPVFGVNAGYDRAGEAGVRAFVGMDEFMAGVEAAQSILRHAEEQEIDIRNVLFVNHAKGNAVFEQRRRGMQETINSNDQANFTSSSSIQLSELILDGPTDPAAASKYQGILEGRGGEEECPFQAIMVSASTFHVAREAFQLYCSSAESDSVNNNNFVWGSFDTNTRLYQAIAVGDLDFCVSQQQWLQAAMATTMASLFATIGMQLQLSSETEFGTYLSGPQVITIQNLPTDTLQICESEGFPVCRPRNLNINGRNGPALTISENGLTEAGCLCFDSQRLQLAAVLHGVETDQFWWPIRDAARQAASDMQANLELDLFPPGDETEVLHSIMASRMISFCQQGVDGLIVSIPSDAVVMALRECQMLNVPIIAINAGADTARDEGLLHFVGQDEFSAGYLAGQTLLAAGATRGICLNHVPDLDFIVLRCVRFQAALTEALGPDAYLGMVPVVPDNEDLTLARAEQAVQEAGGDWENLAILVSGSVLLSPLVKLLERHPEALGGTYDTNPEIVEAVGSGEIEFGIDQQSYLQGYMPVVLLTWFAQAKQALANQNIASGPSFILRPPSAAERQCRENSFAICPPPLNIDFNQLGKVRIVGYLFGGTSVLTAMFFAIYVAWFRNKANIRRSQPFFLLMVCAGSALMGSTIFALAVDDKEASTKACDIACMAAPWLFTIGFSIAFAALYSKLVRLSLLIKHAAHFRRIQVKPKDVMTPFFVLLTLNVAMLTTWTFADPMYWKRSFVSEKESYGICRLGNTAVSIAMAAGIFVVNFMALLFALYEAFKSRKVSYEFSESGSIAIVVASILQVATVGVPILPLVRDDPSASFLLKSGLIFVISMSTSLFIFVPKLRNKKTAVAQTVHLIHSAVATNVDANSVASSEPPDNLDLIISSLHQPHHHSQHHHVPSHSAPSPLQHSHHPTSFSPSLIANPLGLESDGHLKSITENDGEGGTEEFCQKLKLNPKSEKFENENEHIAGKDLHMEEEQHPGNGSELVARNTQPQPLSSNMFLKQLEERVTAGEISKSDVFEMIERAGETHMVQNDEEKHMVQVDQDGGNLSLRLSLDGLVEQLVEFVRARSVGDNEIMDSLEKHGLLLKGCSTQNPGE